MATKIRLQRMGRKKKPFYRIVVSDSRSPRDGRFIESIGYYDPLPEPVDLKIDEKKALQWLNTGAIPSDTVKNLFSSKGIIIKFDMLKKGLPEDKINEELQKHELLVEEKNKRKVLLREETKKKAKKAPEPPKETAEKTADAPAEEESQELTPEETTETEKTAAAEEVSEEKAEEVTEEKTEEKAEEKE